MYFFFTCKYVWTECARLVPERSQPRALDPLELKFWVAEQRAEGTGNSTQSSASAASALNLGAFSAVPPGDFAGDKV